MPGWQGYRERGHCVHTPQVLLRKLQKPLSSSFWSLTHGQCKEVQHQYLSPTVVRAIGKPPAVVKHPKLDLWGEKHGRNAGTKQQLHGSSPFQETLEFPQTRHEAPTAC